MVSDLYDTIAVEVAYQFASFPYSSDLAATSEKSFQGEKL